MRRSLFHCRSWELLLEACRAEPRANAGEATDSKLAGDRPQFIYEVFNKERWDSWAIEQTTLQVREAHQQNVEGRLTFLRRGFSRLELENIVDAARFTRLFNKAA